MRMGACVLNWRYRWNLKKGFIAQFWLEFTEKYHEVLIQPLIMAEMLCYKHELCMDSSHSKKPSQLHNEHP